MNKLLFRFLSILTVIGFLGVMGSVIVQIMSRYLPYTASWTEELTRYFFLFTICIGGSLGVLKGEYIDVDVIVSRIPMFIRKYYEIGIYILILILNVVIIKEGYTFTMVGKNQSSATMGFSMAYVHFGFVILGVFSSYYSIVQIVRILRNRYDFDKYGEEG